MSDLIRKKDPIRENLEAPTGSSLSGYLPSGVGATAETVQDELRKTYRTSNYASLAVALTAAAGKELIVDSVMTVAASLTIPVDIQINVKTGSFAISSGQVLTIAGPFKCQRKQAFSGLGSVKFTNSTDWSDENQIGHTTTVYPEWWGTGVDALQAACYSIAAQVLETTSPTYFGGVVSLANSYYKIASTLIIPDHVCVRGPSPEQRQACIKATGAWTASNPVVQLGRVLGTQYWAHGAQLHDCTVDANHLANVGVYSNMANENSGVAGLIVRKWLLAGIHFEDSYIDATSARLIHNTVSKCDVFCDTAVTPSAYPNPELCVGIKFSSSGTSKNSASGQFASFVIDRCTFSNAAGQTAYYAANQKFSKIGAGFAVDGLSNVSIYDSHAEFCDVDVRWGKDYPCFGGRVSSFDGYSEDAETIQICEGSDNILCTNVFGYFYASGGETNKVIASNVISTKAHCRLNNDLVYVISATAPTTLTAGFYYVVNKTTDTFQISLASGGAAVALTAAGFVNFANATINDKRSGVAQKVFDAHVTEYSTGRIIHGGKTNAIRGIDSVLSVTRGVNGAYRPAGRIATFEHSTAANVEIAGGTTAKLQLLNTTTSVSSSVTSDSVGHLELSAVRYILATGLPTYVDNAAAVTAGLTAGTLYKTSTGVVMIRY